MRDAAIGVGASRLLSLVATFAATPFIVRGLGSTSYGILVTVTMISSVLSFSDLGVGSGLVSRLATARSTGSMSDQRALVASSIAILLCSGAMVGTVLLFLTFALPVEQLFGGSAADMAEVRASLRSYVVLFAIGVPTALGSRVLTAMQRGGKVGTWTGAIAVVSSIATATAATLGGGLLLVTILSVIPAVVLGLVQTGWVLLREYPELMPRVSDLNWGRTVSLSRSSGGFLVLQLAIALSFQTDIFVVSALLGPADAARYSLSMRLFGLVTMAATLVSTQFWAATADALARGDLSWVRRYHLRLTILSTALAAAGSTLLIVVGQPFMGWWATESLVPPLSLLIVMGLWTTWLCAFYPTAMLLNGAQALKVQVFTAIAMAMVNLPLSLFLTPHLGIIGPVVGSLLASIGTTGFPIWRSCRRVLNQ